VLSLGAALTVLLRPDSAPDDLPTAIDAPAAPIAAASAPQVPPVIASSTDTQADPGASDTAATDRAAEALRRAMLQRASDRSGRLFIDYLAEQGLSRTDAEVVVARLIDDLTVCTFDALRAQAAAQNVPFDQVLDAVESTLYDTDGPDVAAVIDVRALVRREAPCTLNALQQSGIPQTGVARLSLQFARR
jgi:hypothetical protein